MKLNMYRTAVAGLSILILSACVVDPNAIRFEPIGSNDRDSGGSDSGNNAPPQPQRKLVKTIGYRKGEILYHRTTNSTEVNPGKTRICLTNVTGQPKRMVWRKASEGQNNLSAPSNGSRSCANFALNQRVEWTFYDRSSAKHVDGMNLGGVGGTLIEFKWVRDY